MDIFGIEESTNLSFAQRGFSKTYWEKDSMMEAELVEGKPLHQRELWKTILRQSGVCFTLDLFLCYSDLSQLEYIWCMYVDP